MAKKIEVVDSHPQTSTNLSTFLDNEGYNVFEADNLKDAVEIAKKEKPDLILLGVKFGERTIESYIGDFQGKIIIIIADHSEEKLEKEARKSGKVVGILRKPIGKDDLLRAVEKFLNK